MDERIDYLCDQLGRLSGIPIRVLSKEKSSVFERLSFSPDIVSCVMNRIKSTEYTVSYYDIAGTLYVGAIKVPENELLIIIGPSPGVKIHAQHISAVLREIGEPNSRADELLRYLQSIPPYSLEMFLTILCTMSFALNGEMLNLYDLVSRETSFLGFNLNSVLKMDYNITSDEPISFSNYEQEQKLMSLITAGRTGQLQEMFEQPTITRIASIAHDNIRQHKNNFICAATLASRAAITGGLTPEKSFSISNLYIKKVELTQSAEQISLLNMEMIMEYAQEVERINCYGSSSKLVIEVARYITKNIGAKIKADDIADALKINRTHLCERFKAETGKTLNDFITERKMQEGKYLLATTTQTVVQISNYLGYSSQGHFQGLFKKYVGCTPGKYRQQQDVVIT